MKKLKEQFAKLKDIWDEFDFELPPGYRKQISIGVVVVTMALGYLYSQPGMTAGKADPLRPVLTVEKTVIQMKNGDDHTFELEIAKTPVDIQIGLMFRDDMPKDHGMMFQLWRDPKPVSFWMKNTYIPLDMLFVGQDGKIVNIHRNATPLSTVSIPSKEPVTGVIELNGGRAEKLGIEIGDIVVHRFFHTAEKQPLE